MQAARTVSTLGYSCSVAYISQCINRPIRPVAYPICSDQLCYHKEGGQYEDHTDRVLPSLVGAFLNHFE